MHLERALVIVEQAHADDGGNLKDDADLRARRAFSMLERVVRLMPARSASSCAVRPRSVRPTRINLPSMASAWWVTLE